MKTLGEIGLTIIFLVYKVNCVHLASIIKWKLIKISVLGYFTVPHCKFNYFVVLKKIRINFNILIHNLNWFEHIERNCKSDIKISNYKSYLMTDPLLLAEMLP